MPTKIPARRLGTPRSGGYTKTQKSRSALEILDEVAGALKEHRAAQAMQRLHARKAWQDNDLVCKPFDAANVRRSFRPIIKAAGLEECWDAARVAALVRVA